MSTRPTARALDDLDVALPPLDCDLSLIDHPLIADAQEVPDRVAAGGGKRVVAIDDEVWFKTKVADYRGAAGQATTDPKFGPGTDADLPGAGWWLVAAGHRKADTPGQDFYKRLQAECERKAKGMHQDVSSAHLLPTWDDWRRWELEATARAVIALQAVVREAITRSAQTGGAWECTVGQFQIQALLVSKDGDTYLALTATGFWDYKVVATILGAVPEVPPDDWQVEPGSVVGITPESGQVIYSTILPPEHLSSILESVDAHFL